MPSLPGTSHLGPSPQGKGERKIDEIVHLIRFADEPAVEWRHVSEDVYYICDW